MGALRFVTWNVNGAGSKENKLKIFSQLKNYKQTLFYYKRLIDLPQLQISLKQLSFLMCSQPAITLGKGGVAILIHKMLISQYSTQL